jgi:hypothetical protein
MDLGRCVIVQMDLYHEASLSQYCRHFYDNSAKNSRFHRSHLSECDAKKMGWSPLQSEAMAREFCHRARSYLMTCRWTRPVSFVFTDRDWITSSVEARLPMLSEKKAE